MEVKKYQRPRHILTIEVARDLISYEPDTGIFRWKKSRNGLTVVTGSAAGAFDRLGYKRIFILGKSYQAAQLAYFLVNGIWPTAHMDHINGIRDDDRWENLRPATISQNGMNKTISSRNTTGAKGVTQYSKNFVAKIKVDKKTISIGSYPTLDEAAHAYNKAAIKHFGEFAVLNPIGQDESMKQENCLACGGTGEKNGDGQLDCVACDAADNRLALNAYMQSMRQLTGADRDWAIYQYAQKQTAAVSAAPWDSFEVEKTDDEHFDSSNFLLNAAQEWWDASKRANVHGAVKWLDSEEGALLIYTRGEYKDALLENIHKLDQKPVNFVSAAPSGEVERDAVLTPKQLDTLRFAAEMLEGNDCEDTAGDVREIIAAITATKE